MASFCSTEKVIELLTAADPHKIMFLSVISETRLALGANPSRPSAVIDLSKEALLPFSEGAQQVDAPQVQARHNIEAVRVPRRSGTYWYELNGRRSECQSLKQLLAASLLSMELHKAGTLDELSKIKGRSRRIVARDPALLFDKGHLARDYAASLAPGWYYGTNNSASEVATWLQRACECADLEWQVNFKTSIAPTLEELLEDIA